VFRPLRAACVVALIAASLLGASTSSAASFGFLTTWGSLGAADGQFSQPDGVATDAAGNVYVVDKGNNRVQKFSSSGAFITNWGSGGTAEDQFNEPESIAIDPSGNVYVADVTNNRIQKFTSSGAFIFAVGWGVSDGVTPALQVCTAACHPGLAGSGDGQFMVPSGIATDPSGNVYVADEENDRIEKFSSSGAFLTKWGTNGPLDGQFDSLHRLTTDVAGNVYTTEETNERVQKFSSSGAFIGKWGSSGTTEGQFGGIDGIAIDPAGNVYTGEQGNNRIQEFTSSGTFVLAAGWGVSDGVTNAFQVCTAACHAGLVGSGDGQFSAPLGVATDCRGNVYVADESNNRVEKFGDAAAAPPPCPPPTAGTTKPSNLFSFGKLKRNKKRGTAKLTVNVPGPGTLTLAGKGVVGQRPAHQDGAAARTVSAAGQVKLLIKAKGKAKKKLTKRGKAKVKINVTFTPTGGDPNSKAKTIKLIKKR
jgi:sugar lactone lactonase YvrE